FSSYTFAGRQLLDLAPASLTFWSAKTGGTQYPDLLLNGVATSAITVGEDGQIPVFQGPDGVTSMWADGGGGRIKIVANSGPTDPGVAGYVADVASATRSALDAAYARRFVDLAARGAVQDGTSHPLSTRYGTLAAAQAAYPLAGITSLTQEID